MVNISHQASRSRLSDAKKKKDEGRRRRKRSGIRAAFCRCTIRTLAFERLSPASGAAGTLTHIGQKFGFVQTHTHARLLYFHIADPVAIDRKKKKTNKKTAPSFLYCV